MIRWLLFKNLRFVYRISHWTRHRFSPVGMLILGGMVASAIFAIDTRQSLSFQIFTITAVMLLLSVVSVLTFRSKLSIKRLLPDFATAGQPFNYRILIKNLKKHHEKDLILIDELATPLPDYEEFSTSYDPIDSSRNWFDRVIGYPRLMTLIRKKRGASILPVEVREIPADDEIEINIEVNPIRRGYLNFSGSRIARPDPFGLFRAMQEKPDKDNLLIMPKLYRVPHIHLHGMRKYQLGGMNLTSAVGDSQEFMSLRDYQPGDPIRAIHWRSYAKTGKPIVKEFQNEFFVRQGLVLDTFIEDKSDAIFEEAVSIAASIALSTQDQDSLLDLMFIGPEAYCFTSGRGLSTTENMLEILACVQPSHEKSFNKLDELICQHTGETSGLICVLLDWDEKRRKLIEKINRLDIPLFVFIITDTTGSAGVDPDLLVDQPGYFTVLRTGMVQEDIDQSDFPMSPLPHKK
ncbi:MAG: DUF58 domain-containing protein [Proteobacteria bacterium]|nr:DUF58 domain-containing protein [Pseudomonadota bacterium]